jgi:hypothetical protein
MLKAGIKKTGDVVYGFENGFIIRTLLSGTET